MIIHTKTTKVKKLEKNKNALKNKRAKQCIDCEQNKEGFCTKYKKWCSKARIDCEECIESSKHYYANGALKQNITKNKKKKKKTKKKKKKTK